jgi:hypothetical protein
LPSKQKNYLFLLLKYHTFFNSGIISWAKQEKKHLRSIIFFKNLFITTCLTILLCFSIFWIILFKWGVADFQFPVKWEILILRIFFFCECCVKELFYSYKTRCIWIYMYKYRNIKILLKKKLIIIYFWLFFWWFTYRFDSDYHSNQHKIQSKSNFGKRN